MAEKPKGKSQKRSDSARSFIGLGRIESGLPFGLRVKTILVGVGIALLTTALVVDYEFQSIPTFSIGDISDRTIEAPRDFTVLDESATQEKREVAIRSVPAIFTFDFRINHRVAFDIQQSFTEARQLIAETREELGIAEGTRLSRADQQKLSKRIADLVPRLSFERTLEICLRYEFSRELEDQLVQILFQTMKYPGVVLNRATLLRYRDRGIVLRNQVTGESEELSDWLSIRDRVQASDTLRQLEFELTLVTGEEKKELINFLDQWIVPNTYFDEEATREAEQRASADVDPVAVQVKQGKALVRAGDEITAQDMSQLKALKELNLGKRWVEQVVAAFLLASFMLFILWSYLDLRLVREKHPGDFALLAMVLLGVLLINRLFFYLGETVARSLRIDALQDPQHFFFFAPLALGPVIVVLLLGPNLTIFFSLIQSVFVGLLTGEFALSVYSLTGSLIAIYVLRQYRERSAVVQAGLWIGGVNLLVAFSFQMWSVTEGFDPLVFLVRSVAALVSGLTSAILSTLFLPSLESLFGLTTDIRLLELSNLNSPILRRLALEAPGTYHHSITVGTLAEAGADAIEANSLLIRVGAYYHDIGKLRHPEYYVENQVFSVNKHEGLSPSMSSLILASHVKDGLAIADEIGLGPTVAALIPQHHGTRVMTYFFQKAKELAAEKNCEVREDDFRYPGPKPQSREAAILMLADQVEAAARTLQDPTPGQIRSLISRIIQATIQDGQLDECDIAMKDVARVARAFERVLTGIHHHRIEYPGFNFGRRQIEEQPGSERVQ